MKAQDKPDSEKEVNFDESRGVISSNYWERQSYLPLFQNGCIDAS